MLSPVRRHLTYANVMSTIAVFVALGGVSYAAATLPRHSVGTRQLKDNAVTSPKVKNRTLLAKDFKKGQLPKGATGKTGKVGPKGAQGAKGDTGDPGHNGSKGNTGDIGPTEGGSSDSMSIANDTSLDTGGTQVDDPTFTTSHAGRVFVSRTLVDESVSCTSGSIYTAYVMVDGTRLPGALLTGSVSLKFLNYTLSGVTATSLPAGTHDAKFLVKCGTGSVMSFGGATVKDLTDIVLGS
jgi:hypothetical protein